MFRKAPAVICFSFALAGCFDSSDSIDVNEKRAATTLAAQLVDIDTFESLDNVEIKVLVDGSRYLTTTTVQSEDPRINGYFNITNIPEGQHKLIIEASGYAPIEANFSISESKGIDFAYTSYSPYQLSTSELKSFESNGLQLDLGKVALSRPVASDVLVTMQGAPVAGISVIAKAVGDTSYCNNTVSYVSFLGEFTSKTDAEGKVSFANMNKCASYQIIVLAQDLDKDGVYDFHTKYSVPIERVDAYGAPIHLAVMPFEWNTPLEIAYATYKPIPSKSSFGIPKGLVNNTSYVDAEYFIREKSLFSIAFNTSVTVIEDIVMLSNSENSLQMAPISSAPMLTNFGTTLSFAPPEGGYGANRFLALGGRVQGVGIEGNDTFIDFEYDTKELIYVSPEAKPAFFGADIDSDSGGIRLFFSEVVAADLAVKSINGKATESQVLYADSNGKSFAIKDEISCEACPGYVFVRNFTRHYEFRGLLGPGTTVDLEYRIEDLDGNVVKGEKTITLR